MQHCLYFSLFYNTICVPYMFKYIQRIITCQCNGVGPFTFKITLMWYHYCCCCFPSLPRKKLWTICVSLTKRNLNWTWQEHHQVHAHFLNHCMVWANTEVHGSVLYARLRKWSAPPGHQGKQQIPLYPRSITTPLLQRLQSIRLRTVTWYTGTHF